MFIVLYSCQAAFTIKQMCQLVSRILFHILESSLKKPKKLRIILLVFNFFSFICFENVPMSKPG